MSRKILIGLAAGAFALAGCKKADTPAPATAPDAATAAVPASTHSFAPAHVAPRSFLMAHVEVTGSQKAACAQSVSFAQPWPMSQIGHSPPPQSTSVSALFLV